MKKTVILLSSVISFVSVALAGTPENAKSPKDVVGINESAWRTPLFGTGLKTSDDYTEGNVYLTFPLHSTIGTDGRLEGDYIFIEPYFSVGEDEEMASSIGVGWRHLFSNQATSALGKQGRAGLMDEGLYIGASLFVDMLNTEYDNQFWQLGVGAEVGTRYVELRGNYYIPLSDEQLAQRNVSTQKFSSSSTRYSQSAVASNGGVPYATGNSIVQDALFTTTAVTTIRTTTVRTVTEIFEKGMEGWDVEASLLVPWVDEWMDVRVIGGYYSFDNFPFGPQEFGSGNVKGWKAGLEVRPVPAVILSATWYEDKRLTGGDWTLGVQFQIPLDHTWKDAFRMRRRHLVERLAEPVRRQNEAVKVGNRKEEHTTSKTSLRRVTRVVNQGPGRIVIADDIVFVNNGAAVGNGIQAGDEVTGDGTAEKPKAVIQSGADIAQANSNSTGRVWSVYTQGTATPYTGAGNDSSVSATTGSVNFIGSGKLITAPDGRTFGQGPAPQLNGGFFADTIGTFGVNGYVINGGMTGQIADGISVFDVNNVNIIGNTIQNIINSGDAIYLSAEGGVTMNALVQGNTIPAPDGSGVHIDSFDNAVFSGTVAGNTITNSGGDGIALHSFSSAPFTAALLGNTVTGSGNDAVNVEANIASSTMNLNFTGNQFAGSVGDGVDFDTGAENVNWNFLFSGNTFDGNQDENLDLKIDTFAGQVLAGNITDNIFNDSNFDNLYIWLDSGAAGPRSSYTGTISGNTFSNSGDNGIHIDADGTGAAPNNTLINATISGNTFNNALGNYIATHAYGTSNVTVNQTGNTFNSAVGDAILAEGYDNAVVNFTATNNTVNNQSDHGIHLLLEDAASGTATISGNTITNNFNHAIFVENIGATAATLNATISGNTINGVSAGHGVFVNTLNGRTSNVTITGNNLSNINGSAFILQNSTGSGTGSSTLHVLALDNNTVNTTSGSAGYGLISQTALLSTTTFDSISNNTFSNLSTSGMSFLSQGLAGTEVTLSNVNNNTITNTIGFGIYADVEGIGAELNANLTNNNLTNTAAGGIKLAVNDINMSGANTMVATVTGNTINGVSNSSASGILAETKGTSSSLTLVSVSNNNISGLASNGTGINIKGTDGNMNALKVDGNTISVGNVTGASGIYIQSTGTGFVNFGGGTVNNNIITGVKETGIWIAAPFGANPSGVTNGIVSGNTITLNDSSNARGILLVSNNGAFITSLNIHTNTINGVGNTGIELVNGLTAASEINAVLVNNNTISGMVAAGISLTEGKGDGFPSRVLNANITNNNITMPATGSPTGIIARFQSGVGGTTATSAMNLNVTGNTVSGPGFRGIILAGDDVNNLGTLNVFNFSGNTVNSGYTGDGIRIFGTTNPALTNINGAASNTIAAPTVGGFRVNVSTGAGTVTGTIIINGGSVNLNTTPTIP